MPSLINTSHQNYQPHDICSDLISNKSAIPHSIFYFCLFVYLSEEHCLYLVHLVYLVLFRIPYISFLPFCMSFRRALCVFGHWWCCIYLLLSYILWAPAPTIPCQYWRLTNNKYKYNSMWTNEWKSQPNQPRIISTAVLYILHPTPSNASKPIRWFIFSDCSSTFHCYCLLNKSTTSQR